MAQSNVKIKLSNSPAGDSTLPNVPESKPPAGLCFEHSCMLKINDILIGQRQIWRIIDVQADYVVALLQSENGIPVDQTEDNIGEFIMVSDIQV